MVKLTLTLEEAEHLIDVLSWEKSFNIPDEDVDKIDLLIDEIQTAIEVS